MSQNKMPPDRYSQMIKHLTRKKIKNPFIPASAIQRPKKILEIEAFQDFNARNKLADGGRIGFKRGTNPEGQKKGKALYDKLYKEYVNLIDEGYKKQKLTTADVPRWQTFIKNKGFKEPSVMYYADERGSPAGLLKDKKVQLVKDIIARENNKLDGMYPLKGGKGGASSLFQGKVFSKGNRLGQGTPGSIETITTNLVRDTLDKRSDKILKAFRVVMNPDYKLTGPLTAGKSGKVRGEISRLIGGKSGPFIKEGDILKTLRTFPEYKNIEEDIKYINRIVSKLPEGADTSTGYLLELSQNNTLGRASFDDWWRLAGDKPEQFAMREAIRNWNLEKGKGQFKFYDLNGKPITWKGKGQSLDSTKVLFSYADPNDLGYKNKLYGLFKPDQKTLKKINKNSPNKGVFDLKRNIRNLPEWNELVEVTDGRNRLFNTEMINPLTGVKEKYKDVFEDIYQNVKTTQFTTKEGYSKVRNLAGHIDHEFGTRVLPFNNLRIVTGQQNQFFNNLNIASQKAANPNLKSYINRIAAGVYPVGASIDNQIVSIINETGELGKVIKANKGAAVTIPSVTQVASSRFLKRKIPNLPQDVVNYITPRAQVAEQIYKQTPALTKMNVQNQKVLGQIARLGGGKCATQNFASGGRINLANSITCLRQGLENIKNKNLPGGPQQEKIIKDLTDLTKTTKGARILSSAARTVAGLGIGTELALGGFFAITDYATGANKQEILSNLTYGLAGKDVEEQLTEQDPMYGKAQKLEDVYSAYLQGFDETGKPITIRPRGMGQITRIGEVQKAMEPFQRPSPQTDEGQFFDLDMFETQKQKDIKAVEDFQKEKTQRALDRGFYEPGFDVFSPTFDRAAAAGGGIAGLSGGDKSGRPPEKGPNSQGLQGLMKRVRNL